MFASAAICFGAKGAGQARFNLASTFEFLPVCVFEERATRTLAL